MCSLHDIFTGTSKWKYIYTQPTVPQFITMEPVYTPRMCTPTLFYATTTLTVSKSVYKINTDNSDAYILLDMDDNAIASLTVENWDASKQCFHLRNKDTFERVQEKLASVGPASLSLKIIFSNIEQTWLLTDDSSEIEIKLTPYPDDCGPYRTFNAVTYGTRKNSVYTLDRKNPEEYILTNLQPPTKVYKILLENWQEQLGQFRLTTTYPYILLTPVAYSG